MRGRVALPCAHETSPSFLDKRRHRWTWAQWKQFSSRLPARVIDQSVGMKSRQSRARCHSKVGQCHLKSGACITTRPNDVYLKSTNLNFDTLVFMLRPVCESVGAGRHRNVFWNSCRIWGRGRAVPKVDMVGQDRGKFLGQN